MQICIDARYVFPKIDGIGRYLLNLIDKLSEISLNSPDIHYYILENEKFSKNSMLRKFDERKNITFIKIPIQPQTFKNHFIGSYLKKYNFDIYHYPQFDLPWFYSGPRIITSIMDMNPQRMMGFFPTKLGWIKKYYTILTNWISYRKSNLLIAISENTKNEFLNFYKIKDESKIRVVHLGVDKMFLNFSSTSESKEILRCLKTKYNFDKYVLYVGNNRPHKNIKRVLTAFSKIKKQLDYPISFLIVGQQLKRNPVIFELLKKLDIIDDVIVVELSDEELLEVYSGAEIFVYCSLAEGFGLPVLEAMSQGTPVLTSNLSSMKEISRDAAVLVDPYSEEEIEYGMLNLLQDENLRNQLSKKGYLRARQFTWEKCAEQTLLNYKKLLNV